MTPPRPHPIRFSVDPRDVPLEKAARRLHLTPEQFRAALTELLRRGFPCADPTTGMFDLQAIDKWCERRNPTLFGLTHGYDGGKIPCGQGQGQEWLSCRAM